MPTGASKPSLFRTPRLRLKLEWHRLKSRVTGLGGVIYYKYGIIKPRPKLKLRQIAPSALALHRRMYTAFAEGDTATLSTICAEGLNESFRARIAARPATECIRWTLHKYTRSARVVSHRGILLPAKASAMRQAVVRIQSRQSLARITGVGPDGQEIIAEETGEEKEIQEYVVVQRMIWKGVEGPWIVWGTTEETSLSKIPSLQEVK
ncbi:Mitochondrial inner membrane protein Mba1 [Lasallia pustulata]|uniref:Mitochondrial inner membrane protein Mba1 n=1 Tax=Lasallia pustulata TaxID=136370 RepID=A0A1W5D5T3_9LECA|nr:Mitochondrial inner membrane protein Mba1 [Lasallia pustulata]